MEQQTDQEYNKELERMNKPSIFKIDTLKENFKEHMDKKQKIVFDYLINKLEKEKILYRFLNNLHVILRDNNYFYLELFEDLSTDYINFENKQEDLIFKYKVDVDKLMKKILEDKNKNEEI